MRYTISDLITLSIVNCPLSISIGTSEYVWALKDINFEVQQGELFGIIDENRADISVSLKTLSKVKA